MCVVCVFELLQGGREDANEEEGSSEYEYSTSYESSGGEETSGGEEDERAFAPPQPSPHEVSRRPGEGGESAEEEELRGFQQSPVDFAKEQPVFEMRGRGSSGAGQSDRSDMTPSKGQTYVAFSTLPLSPSLSLSYALRSTREVALPGIERKTGKMMGNSTGD